MNKITVKNKSNKIFNKILIVIVIIAIICLIVYCILKSFIYPLKHFDIVKKEAASNNLDPYLILSMIKAESGFDKNAISSKQAKGLMQIVDSTADDIKDRLNIDVDNNDLYDPETNIKLGCKYMSYLIEKYEGNYYIAICAYNAGLGNVDKWIEQGIISKDLDTYKNVNLPFKETSKYLNKVITSYNMYRLLY